MSICAQCQDFMPCGDWDLCCKQRVRRLTYEYCEACESIRPGREIRPFVVTEQDGERLSWVARGATLKQCVDFARELASQGYEDVQVRDDRPEELYPLLWMKRKWRDG